MIETNKELIEYLDQKFNKLESEVSELKNGLHEVRRDISTLTVKVDELRSDFSLDSEQVGDHEVRITKLEKKFS